MKVQFILLNCVLLFVLACSDKKCDTIPIIDPPLKIKGMTIDGPKDSFGAELMTYIPEESASEWIAIVPFAFTQLDSSNVSYDIGDFQWWAEGKEGIITMTQYAKDLNLKIMLKPHVWIADFGNFGNNQWVGDYDAGSEEAWQQWETEYEAYIMTMANLADSLEIELFAVGTEYKIAATQRPDYWKNLIAKVRLVYDGEITYSANWDNYFNITFWEDLDYIGINSYFPIIEKANPTKDEIYTAWQGTYDQLKTYYTTHKKPILFTEFGYMSVDYAAWRSWENEAQVNQRPINLQAQANAFDALFERFWEEEWWAGGFIWKWQMDYPNAGGDMNKRYTPENKPSEAVIKTWYSK